MKKINFFYLSLCIAGVFTFSACNDKDDVTPIDNRLPEDMGLFVLNEGTLGSSSNLGFFSYGTNEYTDDIYTGLGQGANDLVVYGSKVYISVTDGNQVLVLDARTKEKLKVLDISLPRYLLAYKGKVYVTSHGENKLTEIDTTSSFSTRSVPVGRTPEQLTTTDGKIYVTNSGWRDALNGGDYDNHISVVNPTTMTIVKDITVAKNISTIAADTVNNVLYVNASAIYDGTEISTPSKLYTVNTATDEIYDKFTFGAEKIVVVPEYKRAYFISSNRTTDDKNTFGSINIDNNNVQNITVANADIKQPYSLSFVPEIGRLIVGDAKNFSESGSMFVLGWYQSSGDLGLEYSMGVGVSPLKFGFTYGSYTGN